MKIFCLLQLLTLPHLEVAKDSLNGRIMSYENILLTSVPDIASLGRRKI
jgi:hypothetical protein